MWACVVLDGDVVVVWEVFEDEEEDIVVLAVADAAVVSAAELPAREPLIESSVSPQGNLAA